MPGTDLYAVAGSKIFIGPAKSTQIADFTEADFSSVTWTEIDGWSTMGAFGDTAEEINTALINRGRNVKQKGTFDAGSMENTFAVVQGDAGQAALIAASKTRNNFPFKVVHSDKADVKSSAVTISQASPGVISWTAHGLPVGAAIQLTTTGALPTGLTAATTYYIIATGYGANSFSVSATKGGSAINTSSAGSGTHTATSQPVGTINYMVGLVMSAQRAGGEANTVQNLTATVSINSNVVEVAALG